MARRSILGARGSAVGLALGCAAVGACGGLRVASERIDLPVDRQAPGREAAEPAPRILTAHHVLFDAPELGGKDAIALVFSVEVDAASLSPRAFWASLESGTRVRAEEAFLSPASEADENRTVLVVGEFGSAGQDRPMSVAIYGHLFAEDGRPLGGLAADVEALAEHGRVALAERIAPAAGRCEGAASAVRTYWTDPVRDVTVEDLGRIAVRMADGRVISPVAFDDHVAGDESGEDNVLDLCMAEGARPVHLSVEAGAFADSAGHRSARVDVEIGDSPAG